jgi:glucose-1-phosphate adenylyltransferase
MEMVSVTPALDLYDKRWPIWTYQEQLPPAKFVFNDDDRRGIAIDSMVSGGCIISGARVHHSLLFSDIRVGSRSEITDSVILSGARIGEDVKLNRVVLDNNCEIPDGMQIGVDREEDAHRFHVSPGGVTLVTPDMLGLSIHHIR